MKLISVFRFLITLSGIVVATWLILQTTGMNDQSPQASPLTAFLSSFAGDSAYFRNYQTFHYKRNTEEKIKGLIEEIDREKIDDDQTAVIIDKNIDTRLNSVYAVRLSQGKKLFDDSRFSEAERAFAAAMSAVNQELTATNGPLIELLSAQAINLLMWAYHMQMTDEREDLLKKGSTIVLKLYPLASKRTSIVRNYAFLLVLQHKFNAALSLLDTIIDDKKARTWHDFYLKAICLDNIDKASDFEETVDKGFLLSTANVYLLRLLIRHYWNNNKLDKLKNAAEIMRSSKINDSEGLFLRGLILFASRDTTSAVNALISALNTDPHNVQCRILLADIYAKSKRTWSKAERELEDLFSKEGMHLTFWDYIAGNLLYAKLLFDREKYAQAQIYLDNLLDKSPNNIRALEVLGRLYYKKKEYEKALDVFTRCVKLFPNSPQLTYNTALVYEKLGDLENAKLFIEKTLGLNDGFIPAIKKQKQLGRMKTRNRADEDRGRKKR